jgi:hypothetical protein
MKSTRCPNCFKPVIGSRLCQWCITPIPDGHETTIKNLELFVWNNK